LPVKVLIVDDSPTIRKMIKFRLQRDLRTKVVGEACNADEARAAIKALDPDVLTLDVEMPGMSGIDFLGRLMRLRPMPVIMVSSETRRGSDIALEALSLGAIDCIGKPFGQGLAAAFDVLPDLVCAAAGANPRMVSQPRMVTGNHKFLWNGKIVLLGASTGGVDALQTVLAGFPENCPPTLIAQHMPEAFLASFARRLESKVAPRVSLATEGALLKQGAVLLAPGGHTHLALDHTNGLRCHIVEGSHSGGFRPSVDVLFRSAVPEAHNAVAAMLTGMGRDGADAMLQLRQAGARCLAQDEATSVVYGMPRAVAENGAAEVLLPIEAISGSIIDLCRKGK
jgi:two-component system chemotaxis response regulator CheB